MELPFIPYISSDLGMFMLDLKSKVEEMAAQETHSHANNYSRDVKGIGLLVKTGEYSARDVKQNSRACMEPEPRDRGA